jgi:alpha-L-rhamnosidase
LPTGSLWFVLQLDEYAARSGDRATVASLRGRVLRLFDFFQKYENSDGLLEKLPSWVFVEWSAANNFVQDVSYPSNMLYAAALDSAGRTYDLPALTAKAGRVRETIRRQSFDGQFFVDNAVRKQGKLEVTRNRTEVCQYMAFYFDVATPQSHAKSWAVLRDQFGPERARKKLFPEVHPANSFVGNMLRTELLSRVGRSQQILDESVATLLYMADRTGTLWENVDTRASCDHGFASHVVHTLYRDVLGLYRVNVAGRKVFVRLGDAKLDWCEGTVPTPQGPVTLKWRRQGGKLLYHVEAPKGYAVQVRNVSGGETVEE